MEQEKKNSIKKYFKTRFTVTHKTERRYLNSRCNLLVF